MGSLDSEHSPGVRVPRTRPTLIYQQVSRVRRRYRGADATWKWIAPQSTREYPAIHDQVERFGTLDPSVP